MHSTHGTHLFSSPCLKMVSDTRIAYWPIRYQFGYAWPASGLHGNRRSLSSSGPDLTIPRIKARLNHWKQPTNLQNERGALSSLKKEKDDKPRSMATAIRELAPTFLRSFLVHLLDFQRILITSNACGTVRAHACQPLPQPAATASDGRARARRQPRKATRH